MNDNNYVNELIKTLSKLIPDNSSSYEEIGQHRISTSNHDGVINITVKLAELEFDDARVKETVANYKKIIEKLDDCLFLEVLDDIKDQLDIKTFSELINQDSYSEEDAKMVESMIDFTNLVIHKHIVDKIQSLKELLEKF